MILAPATEWSLSTIEMLRSAAMQNVAKHVEDESIDSYLLGTLCEADLEAVESHLSSCQECEQRAATAWPFEQLIGALARSGCKRSARPAILENHDRYRLVRRLGEGGMGSVWLAEHLILGSFVALKVIRPERLGQNGTAQRFLREMQTVARLRHPNIVAGLDAEQIGDKYFLAMEFVDGPTLAERIARERIRPIDACRAIRGAALGLSYAHGAGFIHRDIKPSNLIESSRGDVKILDFGLVAAAAGDGSITAQNCVMGTPDYIAPEQAEDARAADARSDIYSLGCTFYQLLSGRVPFPDDSILKKLDGHRLSQPKPLTDINPKLQAIVAKMMAKRPTDRFQSAQEAAKSLEPYCSGRLPASAPNPPVRNSVWLRLVAAAFFAVVAVAGVTVYRIQTDRGELVITSESDDVEVVIKQGGKEITLIDTKSKNGNSITLRSGVYDLELKGAPPGLSLDLQQATLKRGQTTLAKIERTHPGSSKTADARRVTGAASALLATKLTPVTVATINDHKIFAGHKKRIRAVAFSPDDKTIYSGSDDGQAIAWDRETGVIRHRFQHVTQDPRLTSLTFADGGKTLITTTFDSLLAWDAETGQQRKKFDILALDGTLCCAVASPNGRRLAISYLSGRVQVLELPTGKLEADFPPIHGEHAYHVFWLRDETRLVYGLANGTVVIQNTADRRATAFWRNEVGVIDLAASPDGKTVSYTNWHGIVISFDAHSNKATGLIGTFDPADKMRTARVVYAPNGWLVTAGRLHLVDLWNAKQGLQLAEFAGGSSQSTAVAVSNDGRWLVAGGESDDPTVRLWRMPEK